MIFKIFEICIQKKSEQFGYIRIYPRIYPHSRRTVPDIYRGNLKDISKRFWSDSGAIWRIISKSTKPSIKIYANLLILRIIRMDISRYIKIAKMAYFGALKVIQKSILGIKILYLFVALDLNFEINSYFMLLYALKLKYVSWIISNSTKMAKSLQQFCLQFTKPFFILKY